jgi:murein DD-endopeptidase MepM/ murein hydrolase activator NlpD
MAGGGVKGGQTIGATGKTGLRSVGEQLDVLGLDHERLTYTRNGRAERPTIASGAVIGKLTT